MIEYEIREGDVIARLREMPEKSVHCVVTSPPYFGLRNYGVDGQIGLEQTPEAFIEKMVDVFREVWRVLRDDGTLWLNIGSSYAGSGRGRDADGTWNPGKGGSKQATNSAPTIGRLVNPDSLSRGAIDAGAIGNAWVKPPKGWKQKDLINIPYLLSEALRVDGWYLRSDIIWAKKAPMPESCIDRPTCAHEHIFLLTKRPKYFYDSFAVRTPQKDAADTARRLRDAHDGQAKSQPDEFHNGIRPRTDKQRGHSRRHDGFNDRWDAMSKDEQMSMGANLRNVWHLGPSPFKEAHFATFVPEVPMRCIKAGTSEYGVCSTCGAPWRRIVEKRGSNKSGSGKAGNVPVGKLAGGTQVREGHDIRMGPTVESTTVGFESTCKCENNAPVPATVLDTFSGAATTGVACLRLGRNYIGIELNPEYVAMSVRRLEREKELLANPERPKRHTKAHEQSHPQNSLFE